MYVDIRIYIYMYTYGVATCIEVWGSLCRLASCALISLARWGRCHHQELTRAPQDFAWPLQEHGNCKRSCVEDLDAVYEMQ